MWKRLKGLTAVQVTKWADVPEQAKEKTWKHIQDHAVVNDERKKRFSRRLGLACAILGQSKGSGCGFEK
ncbi:hypothetical protein AAC387_Pa09g0702 [Persea americana]